jgi:hypothetical protein
LIVTRVRDLMVKDTPTFDMAHALGESKLMYEPPTTLPCSCVHLRSSSSASLSFFIPHSTLHPHILTIYTSALIHDLFISRVCSLTVRHPAHRHLGLSARVNALRVRLAGRCGFESRHIQFFFFFTIFLDVCKRVKRSSYDACWLSPLSRVTSPSRYLSLSFTILVCTSTSARSLIH